MSRQEDLRRIAQGLERARAILSEYTAGSVEHRFKSAGDPVTEADTRVNDALRECLPRDGEGWLSEETADDPARLKCERVWIVDPLDGTREFVEGVPEWCVSIGLVEGGRPVAGGIEEWKMWLGDGSILFARDDLWISWEPHIHSHQFEFGGIIYWDHTHNVGHASSIGGPHIVTERSRYFGFPLWYPVVLFAIPAAVLWLRDHRAVEPGHCPRCGYNLTGNESGVCPECATPVPKRETTA